jgi:hypothetical protein
LWLVVANWIVLQQAAKRVQISFWQFARVGLVLTLLTALLEMGILVLEHKLFPGSCSRFPKTRAN